MSASGTAAVNGWAAECGTSATPFHMTSEVLMKFVPVSVSVNAAPPAVADAGASKVRVGRGVVMVSVSPFDVPPPGAAFTTVTVVEPELAMSVLGIDAVKDVALTKVVERLLRSNRQRSR